MRTKNASYVKMYDLYSPRIPLPDNLFNGTVALMKPHFSGFSKHGSNPRCSGAFGVIMITKDYLNNVNFSIVLFYCLIYLMCDDRNECKVKRNIHKDRCIK